MRSRSATFLAAAALLLAGPASAAHVAVTYDLSGSDLEVLVPGAAIVTGTLVIVFTADGGGNILDGPAWVVSADANLDLDGGALPVVGIGGVVDVSLNGPIATTLTGNALADSSGIFSANGSITCATGQVCDTVLALDPVLVVDEPGLAADVENAGVDPLTAGLSVLTATQSLELSIDPEAEPIPATVSLVGTETGRVLTPDTDGDGVPDLADNCINVANATQCDTDNDGYGNICDGDFNNNGAVQANDFTGFFQPNFLTGIDTGTGTDMNCNGAVQANDFTGGFQPQFLLGAPGPSALSCAGTVPCP